MKRIKMKGGDEYDALSRKSKRLFKWASGVRKKLKRKYNKRFRKIDSYLQRNKED
jgi:hypothetical protein